jgi:hypothetical protein
MTYLFLPERAKQKEKKRKMPKISDHEEFLNASMVKDKEVVVMLDTGAFREPEETGFQRTVFQVRVRLPDGRTKTWTMNKTTRSRLALAYGDDTASWVNRLVQVQVLQQNVRGEVKQVLYGYPVEGVAAPAPVQALMPSAPALPPVPKEETPHERMIAWIRRHPELVGREIPSTVYNAELALDKVLLDELVKEKIAYLKNDKPFLDEKARKHIG